jgi:hypothetical protein
MKLYGCETTSRGSATVPALHVQPWHILTLLQFDPASGAASSIPAATVRIGDGSATCRSARRRTASPRRWCRLESASARQSQLAVASSNP